MKYAKLLFFFLVCFHINAQSLTNKYKKEEGKCYVKLDVYPKLIEPEVKYYVYTGDDKVEENDNLEVVVAGYQWGGKIWEKRYPNRGIDYGYYGIEQFVYCLIEYPEIEGENIIVVKDTFWTKDYVEEVFTERYLLEEEEGMDQEEWFEILCRERVNTKIIKQLVAALKEKGYEAEDEKGDNLTIKIQKMLVKFQQENGFPQGYYDIGTLNALGIEY